MSIFDTFKEEDVVFAFFPCVRFEAQILLSFRGQMHGMEKWSYRQKMVHCMKLMRELHEMYDLVNKLFIIAIDKGFKLIVENPFSEEHFLRRYWCYPPSIIDKDRRMNGDYMKKPTQYWFVNCEPLRQLVFEPIDSAVLNSSDLVRQMTGEQARMIGAKTIRTARSKISTQYANRFIRQYILPEEMWRNAD